MTHLATAARLTQRARIITAQRNEAMRTARAEGATLRAIAVEVGMSVEGVRYIVDQEAKAAVESKDADHG